MFDDAALCLDQATLKQLNTQPITIAVVGHVNIGKSSVLQTLCHDPDLRLAIGNEAGTTTEVESWNIKHDGTTYMVLRDTPGIEHATEALEALDYDLHFSVEDVIEYFRDKFPNDYKALQGARSSDYLLYVVDVTKKPTEDLINEFLILHKVKKMITLFNFVTVGKDLSYREQWETQLRSHGMHEFCEYDAHHYDIHCEQQLLAKLSAATPPQSLHYRAIEIHGKIMSWEWLKKSSASTNAIVDLLVTCAVTHTCREKNVDRATWKKRAKELQVRLATSVAKSESDCLMQILQIHGLPKTLLERKIEETEVSTRAKDAFFSRRWKRYIGGGVSSGALTGAVIGGTIDAFVGGASFGLGVAIGAGVGAAAGFCAGNICKGWYDAENQLVTVAMDKEGQRLLLARSLHFLYRVQRRGLADPKTEFVVGSESEMQHKLKETACEEHVKQLIELLVRQQSVADRSAYAEKELIAAHLRVIMRLVGIWKVQGN